TSKSPDGLRPEVLPGPDLGTQAGAASVAHRLLRGPRDYAGALVALVVILVVLATSRPGFASSGNMQNVLQYNTPLLLVSLGMTFVVISGGFDLSVGALMALAEEVLMLLINDAHISAPLAVLLTVLISGAVGGLLNGVAIGIAKLNFFVATLASMILIQGIVLVASGGNTTVINSAWLQSMGNKIVVGVPVPVIIAVGLIVVAWFVLHMTTFGRAVYCIGGNREAARLSGISVPVAVVGVYAVSGMFGALAGVADAAHLSAATPTAGSNLALTSAAAVLLGGASLAGGVGKVGGTVTGVLVLALLGNGVDLYGVSAYWQDVVTGAVLFVAILLDRLHKSGATGSLLRLLGPRRPVELDR
ncbi:MAG: ABC transporter permease, partial [Actinobacteria bacterium]|nr:ABC transporter permease [Actinomycetota bacterium]